ncbi:MAG: response regulator [Spirochaetales bacterium]|nr:MAG: response regulator [Spirochaetales bacterium]
MDMKKRILVVDDEQINLEFFDVMLSKLGFSVHKAENGQEALDSIRRLKPDLVILDNIMPKVSGWEVTKIVKSSPEYAEYADTPIIMFSALDDVKDKVEGLELGADDYITKPFNFAEVLARIRAVLRTHDLMRQIENRERRLHIGDKAVDDVQSIATELRQIIGNINSSCSDADTVKNLAKESSIKLDALERRIASLKEDTESLRKEAADMAAIRTRIRADVR